MTTDATLARTIPVPVTTGDMADLIAAAHALAADPNDTRALCHITTFARRALQPTLDALPYLVAQELLRSGRFGAAPDHALHNCKQAA